MVTGERQVCSQPDVGLDFKELLKRQETEIEFPGAKSIFFSPALLDHQSYILKMSPELAPLKKKFVHLQLGLTFFLCCVPS